MDEAMEAKEGGPAKVVFVELESSSWVWVSV
jgi:hypothetical protein